MQHRILWRAHDIAKAVSGQLSQEFEATGVSIDSRTLKPGDLFIAISGPKVDGHDYVKDAFKAGACGAIVTHIPQGCSPDSPYIVVADSERALEDLGRIARQRTNAKVLAITGSFGKTGTKEALRHVLSKQGKTSATESSFNNHWGVPLTLSRLYDDDDFGIFELGMNHPGELTPLSNQVRPEIALITAIGASHLAQFGRVEAIADAKAEIFNGMEAGRTVVLNADDRQYERLAQHAHEKQLEILKFGITRDAPFNLVYVKAFPEKFEVMARTPVGDISYEINVLGDHWVMNSLAVLAMVYAAGADVKQAAQDLATFELFEGRGKMHHVRFGVGSLTLIDESYNAGPDSMHAALRVLGRAQPGPQGRRIAILGDMLELGEKSQEYHEGLLSPILEQNIDIVFTCGPHMIHLWELLPPNKRAYHHNEVDPLITKVLDSLRPGDVIMAKGSRGQRAYRGRMSKFIDAILALDKNQVA